MAAISLRGSRRTPLRRTFSSAAPVTLNRAASLSPQFPAHLRGQSLILVLGCLIFLSALVLALLAGFGTEKNSSNNYANGATVRELANSTVNLVMGEIVTATSGQDSSGNTLAWASQPGMIRTYDTTGNMNTAYRLYSASSLTVTGSINPSTEASALANWSAKPALFTDLNSPLLTTTGTSVYPILDPGAADTNESAPTSGVEGFWFGQINDPSSTGGGSTIGNVATPAGVSNGQMPVSWVYVLKDGQIIAPDATSTGTATFANASTQPTTTNPIVGRMAFWTDDESCKVNINTASAGALTVTASPTASATKWTQSFWDTPRVFTYQDRSLGSYQPYQNEFQRYPGHPATTDLTTALPASLTSSLVPANIYDITPRYNSGTTAPAGAKGSQLATIPVPTTATSTGTLAAMPMKYNRIYSTVDELMFMPTLAFSIRASQGITQSQLEMSRFFITASSRAPEVNIFNRPRVAAWPISANGASYETTTDQTIAFCSTISGTGYYFQRADPTSPTNDYGNIPRNQQLFQYLHNLTNLPSPGFSSGNSVTLSSKYSTNSECDQILTEIFDYIRCININDPNLASAFRFSPVISAATSAAAPISASGGQVVPIQITSSGATHMGFGRFALPYEIGMDFVGVGTGTFVLTGSGTTTTLASVPVAPAQYDSGSNGSYAGVDGNGNPPQNSMAIMGCLVMSFMNPGAGSPSYNPSFTVKVTGMDAFTLGQTGSTTTSMNFPASGTTYVQSGLINNGGAYTSYGSVPGGIIGPMGFVANKVINPSLSTYTATTQFPFVSKVIVVPYKTSTNTLTTTSTTTPSGSLTTTAISNTSTGTFYFGGGTINISIYAGNNTDSAHLIETISNVNIPSSTTTFSFPSLADPSVRMMGNRTSYTNTATPADKFVSSLSNANSTYFGWDFGKSATAAGTTTLSSVVNGSGTFTTILKWGDGQDNVQSLVIPHGDGRLAFQTTVSGSTFFSPDTAGTTGVNASFVNTVGSEAAYQKCRQGVLVRGLNPNNFGQYVPYTLSGSGAFINNNSAMPLGDFDSGLPNMQDGPFINKVDEGDLSATSPYIPYYPSWTTYTPIVNSFFSPNRLMPSPGMFGSLSTGVMENKPWQTLLFRPDVGDPNGNNNHHPGAGVTSGTYAAANGTASTPTVGAPGAYTTLPDHLFMDLFWMPIIEPYPISEPFSTAGKINMNYQLMPFAFINRETAIRSVLKYERPLAIPSTPGTSTSITKNWKDMNNLDNMSYDTTDTPKFNTLATDWRYSINLDQTLVGFRQRFAANDLFRSASEICLIPLVPTEAAGANVSGGKDGSFNPTSDVSGFPLPIQTYASILSGATTGFWYNHALTGDNLRERPYTNLYPRLTTKSNTFTVHYKVQTLTQLKSDTALGQWVEGSDVITGEYRGSSIIERYIDPNATIPDYATTTSPPPLSNYYKFRVISTKQFNP